MRILIILTVVMIVTCAYIMSPFELNQPEEKNHLEFIETNINEKNSSIKFGNNVINICIILFPIDKEKIEYHLGRKMTFKQLVTWGIYGTDGDSRGVFLIFNKNSLSVVKFYEKNLKINYYLDNKCFDGNILKI